MACDVATSIAKHKVRLITEVLLTSNSSYIQDVFQITDTDFMGFSIYMNIIIGYSLKKTFPSNPLGKKTK